MSSKGLPREHLQPFPAPARDARSRRSACTTTGRPSSRRRARARGASRPRSRRAPCPAPTPRAGARRGWRRASTPRPPARCSARPSAGGGGGEAAVRGAELQPCSGPPHLDLLRRRLRDEHPVPRGLEVVLRPLPARALRGGELSLLLGHLEGASHDLPQQRGGALNGWRGASLPSPAAHLPQRDVKHKRRGNAP